MKTLRRIPLVVALISVAGTFGCGPQRVERPDRARVTGKVTYNGKPVQGGVIVFHSISDSKKSGGGSLKEDGSYSVTNVPIGEAQVTVDTESLKPHLGSLYVKLPDRYMSSEESGLTFTVEAGENSKDFVLED
jgi:hypothetical protein